MLGTSTCASLPAPTHPAITFDRVRKTFFSWLGTEAPGVALVATALLLSRRRWGSARFDQSAEH